MQSAVDIEAYFTRIGYTASRAPTLTTLRSTLEEMFGIDQPDVPNLGSTLERIAALPEPVRQQ